MEKAHDEATVKWRAELIDELEKKGAIKDSSKYDSAKKTYGEDELEEKAKALTEARQNGHMLDLQTNSNVL